MDVNEAAVAFDFREAWRADAAAGRDLPLAHYLERFAGHEPVVAREWVLLTTPPPGAVGGDVGGSADGGGRLGPYRLLRPLGRGGQGTVWLAEDTRLQHRTVALKVLEGLAPGLGSGRTQRLRREAEALARLHHPGIGSILDAQLDGPRPFLVMRYVAGETLQATLQACPPPRTPAALQQVLHWLERTARALHSAHEAGILHRDIKPANIMIDRDGLPVLLDFGLARDASEDASLTMSGEVFGTLAYMAPEQIAGARDLDRRVDVYALGVVAYECLTHTQPFAATSRQSVAKNIESGRCRDPRALNPAVSRDLAVVVATAMDVGRDRRYATARDFADDLANVRERRPVLARPARPWLRLWRWCQRHPLAAVVLASLTVALAAVSALTLRMQEQTRELLAWQRANHAVALADTDPGLALDEVHAAATERDHPEIRSALLGVLARTWQTYEAPLGGGDPNSGLTTVPIPLAGGAFAAGLDGRGEWMIWHVGNGDLRRLPGGHEAQGSAAAVSCDGRHVLTGDLLGTVVVREAARLLAGDLEPLARFADRRAVTVAAACAAAPTFFVGGVEGRCERHDVGTNAPPSPIPGVPVETVAGLWPSPRGDALLVHTSGAGNRPEVARTIVFVDLPTSSVMLRRTTPDAASMGAAWSPCGTRVALLEGQRTMRVLDRTARLLWEPAEQMAVHDVRFTADGTALVAFGVAGLVVHDAATGAVRHRRASPTGRPYDSGWFSPDGRLLAAAVRDCTLRLYETAGWTELEYLGRTRHGLWRYAIWSPDGQLAAFDHTAVHGFRPTFRRELPSWRGHTGAVVSLAHHPTSALLATAGDDRAVRLWHLDDGRLGRELRVERPPLRVAAAVDRVLVVTAEPVARLWPWTAAGGPVELRGHDGDVADGAFLPDGGGVVTIGADGTSRTWTLAGAPARTFATDLGPLRTFAVDERRGLLAVAGHAPVIDVFELATGDRWRRITAPATTTERFVGQPTSLHFDSVHGRFYASGLHGGGVACWSLADDRAYTMLAGMSAGSTGHAVTDPTARWLLCTENGIGQTAWFDAATLSPLPWDRRWEPTTKISRVRFTADGRLALLASFDGTVRLFDTTQLAPWSVLRTHHGGAVDAEFAPDGAHVAVGYRDGTVMVWPTDPMSPARASLVRRR